MNNNYLCYLAGPMSGLTYEEAMTWRIYTIEKLKPIIGLSPVRDCEQFKNTTFTQIVAPEHMDSLHTPRGIMIRDRNDVYRADVVFINFLNAKKVSIGTVMEVAWANRLHKPIVCAIEDNNPHNHDLILQAIDYRVDSVDEGIRVIKSILAI
jgi:nucleoside 2-deoxyribosyltransferase